MDARRRWAGPVLVSMFAVLAPCTLVDSAIAQNVRFEERDGVRYQVSTRKVQRTVPVTEMHDRHQTVYTQQITTENITSQQTYLTPITQYQTVTRLRGRWNPFIMPYYTYDVRPVTTWHQSVANVQVPVSRTAWVPQTQTVQVPVTTYKTAEVEETTRVAMNQPNTFASAQPLSPQTVTIAARPSTTVISSTPLGGHALQNDPPRAGTGWQTPGSSRY